jgi:hypothetical protein
MVPMCQKGGDGLMKAHGKSLISGLAMLKKNTTKAKAALAKENKEADRATAEAAKLATSADRLMGNASMRWKLLSSMSDLELISSSGTFETRNVSSTLVKPPRYNVRTVRFDINTCKPICNEAL